MSDLPLSPATAPAGDRGLQRTRVAAVAPCGLAFLFTVWGNTLGIGTGCSDDRGLISVALWLVGLSGCISFLHLISATPLQRKKGLAWAVISGTFWGVPSLLLAGGALSERAFRNAIVPSLSAAIQLTLAISAIKVYYSAPREKGDWSIFFHRIGRFIVSLASFCILIALPDFLADRRQQYESAAVTALRKINAAEATYASTYHSGFSPTQTALGPTAAGAAASASAAGLIDAVLAHGAAREYSVRYTPGPPDSSGKITTYTLIALPAESECSRWKRFFTDQSGAIHYNSENRLPTASDPSL